jgi:hypothetical protein
MTKIIIDGKEYKLACRMSDCSKNMHTFKQTRASKSQNIEKGCCTQCKSKLVDWDRIYRNDIKDFYYTKSALQFEMIRNVFWNIKDPSPEMIDKVRKLDPDELKKRVLSRLNTTLQKIKSENIWDGRQTSFDDDLIFWAQHATGTCCRGCLEYWHGIDANSPITTDTYEYLQQLIIEYLKEKTK